MASYEDNEGGETLKPSKSTSTASIMTLEKAIEFGEYDPDYLATFPEWHSLTKHIQWEFISKAINNRNSQLLQQYAAVTNVLDFSKKPHLKESLKNIEEQWKKLAEDKEKILMEYSKP